MYKCSYISHAFSEVANGLRKSDLL